MKAKYYLKFSVVFLSVAVLFVLQLGCASCGCSDAKKDSKPPMDLVETALKAGSFKTLATALTAADVVKLTKAKTVNGQSLTIKG